MRNTWISHTGTLQDRVYGWEAWRKGGRPTSVDQQPSKATRPVFVNYLRRKTIKQRSKQRNRRQKTIAMIYSLCHSFKKKGKPTTRNKYSLSLFSLHSHCLVCIIINTSFCFRFLWISWNKTAFLTTPFSISVYRSIFQSFSHSITDSTTFPTL